MLSIETLTDAQRKALQRVTISLREQNVACRLVGGAVRDLLLGKVPSDIDLAVDSPPERVALILRDSGIKVVTSTTQMRHGTVTAIIDGLPVEVTTLRRDVSTDGRHAEVEFTDSWEEDAARRDFTINAMSMDMMMNVHDYFGGAFDLENGIVRFVGIAADRIEEDYLRILRYYRFSSRLEYLKPSSEARSAIKELKDGLSGISGERIWSELLKTLNGPSRVEVLRWMQEDGVLEAISPILKYDDAIVGDIIGTMTIPSSLYVLAYLVQPTNRWSSVLAVNALKERLRFDNNSERILRFLVSCLHRLDDVDRGPAIGHRQFYVDRWDMESSLDVHIVRGIDPELLWHYHRMVGDEEAVAFLDTRFVAPVRFPITGDDLKGLGLVGRDIGMKLEELKVLWVRDGKKMSREELLSRVGETCSSGT